MTVKPERAQYRDPARRANWGLFARSNAQLRGSWAGLKRYVATVQTAKHHFFGFLDGSNLPDDKLIAMGFDAAFFFGVLSSRVQVVFSLAAGSPVVEYSRVHVDYVESEFVVRSGHSCQGKSAAIEEVRRILHDHLKALPAAGTPPLHEP